MKTHQPNQTSTMCIIEKRNKEHLRLGHSIRCQLSFTEMKKPMWLHATLGYIRIHGTGIVTYYYLHLVSFSH